LGVKVLFPNENKTGVAATGAAEVKAAVSVYFTHMESEKASPNVFGDEILAYPAVPLR
jgi:hypothetical protein